MNPANLMNKIVFLVAIVVSTIVLYALEPSKTFFVGTFVLNILIMLMAWGFKKKSSERLIWALDSAIIFEISVALNALILNNFTPSAEYIAAGLSSLCVAVGIAIRYKK